MFPDLGERSWAEPSGSLCWGERELGVIALVGHPHAGARDDARDSRRIVPFDLQMERLSDLELGPMDTPPKTVPRAVDIDCDAVVVAIATLVVDAGMPCEKALCVQTPYVVNITLSSSTVRPIEYVLRLFIVDFTSRLQRKRWVGSSPLRSLQSIESMMSRESPQRRSLLRLFRSTCIRPCCRPRCTSTPRTSRTRPLRRAWESGCSTGPRSGS